MKRFPELLKRGDQVAVIATAKNFSEKEIEPGIRVLESWGFDVVKGKNLFGKFHQFAGNDTERMHDLQDALDQPAIKAIFFARGGYGTTRIIDRIDFSGFIRNPKWLIGFSDLTALHFQANKLGFPSIHGPMPVTFPQTHPDALEHLHKMLSGKISGSDFTGHKLNREGEASGMLIGGNLSLITNLTATFSDMEFSSKILFIEDVGEYLYHLDRLMIHLKRTGKLADLSGLIVGQFTEMMDNTVPFGKTAYEIIADVVDQYSYPVAFNFPAGHDFRNFSLMFGTKARIRVNKNTSHLDYSL